MWQGMQASHVPQPVLTRVEAPELRQDGQIYEAGQQVARHDETSQLLTALQAYRRSIEVWFKARGSIDDLHIDELVGSIGRMALRNRPRAMSSKGG